MAWNPLLEVNYAVYKIAELFISTKNYYVVEKIENDLNF